MLKKSSVVHEPSTLIALKWQKTSWTRLDSRKVWTWRRKMFIQLNRLEFYHEQFYAAKIFTMHTKQTNHRPKYRISSQWKSSKEEQKSSKRKQKWKKGNGGRRSWPRMVWKRNTALPRYMQIFAYGFQAKRLDCVDWFLLLLFNFLETNDDLVNGYSQK